MRKIKVLTALTVGLMTEAATAEIDWEALEGILSRQASEQPGEVRRFGFPRTDMEVTLDDINLLPGFALGSWLAFHPLEDDQAMVMGDLVLTEEEVSPVMRRLAQGGIEVTALHNHLLRADPFPMYLHVAGSGDPVELATVLREAMALSETPLEVTGGEAEGPGLDFDTAVIAGILEEEGRVEGSVYKVGIPRAEDIRSDGMIVPTSMGTAIAINFQSAGNGQVATTGDFVLTAGEVNPVLRALHENGIEVTALHNHMLEEEPRLFFMHFWGVGEPEEVARGLKVALDQVNLP